MNKVSSLAFLLAIVLSSCSVTKTSKTIRVSDVNSTGIIQKPVVVDLDVRQIKVQGIANGKSNSIADLKNKAIEDALTKSSADVLLEPTYTITQSKKKSTVEVSGWPANYKNFRSIEKDDVELLKAGVVQKAETVKVEEKVKNKNATLGWVLLGLGAVVAFIASGIAVY